MNSGKGRRSSEIRILLSEVKKKKKQEDQRPTERNGGILRVSFHHSFNSQNVKCCKGSSHKKYNFSRQRIV